MDTDAGYCDEFTKEVQKLRQQNKELAKENTRLKEGNEFLAEASAFFAALAERSHRPHGHPKQHSA